MIRLDQSQSAAVVMCLEQRTGSFDRRRAAAAVSHPRVDLFGRVSGWPIDGRGGRGGVVVS